MYKKYANLMSIDNAVEKAILECIEEGILAEFLSRNRAEAKKVSIYEYDEEKHMRQEREASLKEGMEKGIEQGIEKGRLQILLNAVNSGLDDEQLKNCSE